MEHLGSFGMVAVVILLVAIALTSEIVQKIVGAIILVSCVAGVAYGGLVVLSFFLGGF